VLHLDCSRALERCPTLGCTGRPPLERSWGYLREARNDLEEFAKLVAVAALTIVTVLGALVLAPVLIWAIF
jgi:hypothetical protein